MDIYSRSLTYNIVDSGRSKITTYGNKQHSDNNSVPVKSFKDNFAYDRFTKMGEEQFGNGKVEESSNIQNVFSENDEKKSLTAENSTEVCEPQVTDTDKAESNRPSLNKFLDFDTLLLIIFAFLLAFSENTTNDKLTPIALLAILFF